MTGTAWTVFQGSTPEPMQVEILGILRGVRGPGQDLILARLHGDKPEYTGVVEGMSGSPVYIDGKLAGSLSYRIGQFTKEPIAGITPIEQMLEVRDIPVRDLSAPVSPLDSSSLAENQNPLAPGDMGFQPLDTPLVMSGFLPEAVRFWQQQTAGTSLEPVAAGGSLAGMASAPASSSSSASGADPSVHPTLEPGSAVSMQLIRGDLEVAATCTVTWVDPSQLLACGHPVLGAGPVSLPMTTADVVATLASPLNSFKIINTGVTIGAFTQDRESAIRGVFGAQPKMIPVHVAVDSPEGSRKVNVEVLDLPSLTPTAVQVVLYDALIQSNQSSEALSYHVTGNIDIAGFPSVPLDLWAPSAQTTPAPMMAALLAGGSSLASIPMVHARASFAPSISTSRPSPARSTSRSTRRASPLLTLLTPATPSPSKPPSALRMSLSATSGSPLSFPPALPPAASACSFPTRPRSIALCFSLAFPVRPPIFRRPRAGPRVSTPSTASMSAFSRLKLRPKLTARPSPAFHSPWPMPSNPCATRKQWASMANLPKSPVRLPPAASSPASGSSMSTSSQAAV